MPVGRLRLKYSRFPWLWHFQKYQTSRTDTERLRFDSDEELSLYDLLFKDDLSKDEIKELKKVAVDLLRKIKDKISQLDHWTDKPETKAVVDNLIRDTLWEELPESYDEHAISKYRMQIYEYVFTRYRSVAWLIKSGMGNFLGHWGQAPGRKYKQILKNL